MLHHFHIFLFQDPPPQKILNLKIFEKLQKELIKKWFFQFKKKKNDKTVVFST